MTANSYTSTFNANSGSSPNSSSKSVTFGGTYGALATTSRTGYTFNGWFTATSGGTEIESSDTVSTASNQTLYAQWTENTLAISPSSTNITVPEGNTATFTVVLSAQPASNVTVNVARIMVTMCR